MSWDPLEAAGLAVAAGAIIGLIVLLPFACAAEKDLFENCREAGGRVVEELCVSDDGRVLMWK